MRFFPTVLATIIGSLIALVMAFFFGLVLLAAVASSGQIAPTVRSGSVLVVPISGFIPEVRPENPFQVIFLGPDRATLHDITRSIRRAADDDRISALWLRTRGSANAWASLEEVSEAVHDFKASGKPVVASSGANGYSEKDFFIASSADLVFSPPAAYFEMNGFVLVLQFVKQLFDKLDIEAEAVRAGNFKSAVEPFVREHASAENLEQLQAIVDAHANLFSKAVASRRGIEESRVVAFMEDAGITAAADAVEAGLIDSLMVDDEVEDFIRDLVNEDSESRLRTISVGDYARSNSAAGGGSGGTIAVVNAFGTIVSGKSGRDAHPVFGGSNVGSETLARTLKRIREDDHIDAVVLRINSPGGSAAASDVIWHAVKRTAAEKPVVASMGDVAASGGYYIAVAADTIVAESTTLTGSIGVFALLLNISGFLEGKIGLTHDAVKTGPYADMFTGLRPLSEHERKILADGVDRVYDRFTVLVAEGRAMPVSEVHDVAQGRIWAGSDALQVGLVDTLGGLHDATRIAAEMAGLDEGEYRIRTYPAPRGLLEQLGELVEATAAAVIDYIPVGGAPEWFAAQGRLLRAMDEMNGTVQARLPVTVSVD